MKWGEMMPKVALVMGSDSDFPQLEACVKTLKQFGVEVDARVISAHRTPDEAHAFAVGAADAGYEVILAAAGKAAHLAGVLAAFTVMPVIGIPMPATQLDGMDALLSMVQMPPGIPVATVTIGGAVNAALLAVQILSVKHADLRQKLIDHRAVMRTGVIEKDKQVAQRAAAL